MKVQLISVLVMALGLPVLLPVAARADAAADKRAEIDRAKAEALKKLEERRKAADLEKKAAAELAAKKAADDKKAEAEKKAAEDRKKEAEKQSTGGTSGTGGATASSTGGAGGTKATGGAGGTGAGGKSATDGKKSALDEKDAPLPAVDIETLRKDRAERRKATVERLRRRWGRVLGEAKGADDLKLHARRVALLQRIRLVAEGKKDKKTIEAVDDLLTKEDERHSKAMNALREGALTAGAPK